MWSRLTGLCAATLIPRRCSGQRGRGKYWLFTYPRDRWYVRTMFAFGNFWLWLTGKKFRAFVHAPKRMAAVLEIAGLVHATQRETLVWMLDLYHRSGARL